MHIPMIPNPAVSPSAVETNHAPAALAHGVWRERARRVSRWVMGVCALGLVQSAEASSGAVERPAKVVIVKADDVRGDTPKWRRFVADSEALGVKVSLGIICDSLVDASPEYVEWLRALERSGRVEFWNHGWDHKRWKNEAGVQLMEFKGTGPEHQAKHYGDAKAWMIKVLGVAPAAFGAPFNATDADTEAILRADSDLKLVFANRESAAAGKFFAPISLKGEHDGTGKPNFEKFRAEYAEKPDLTLLAFQVHPQSFGEEHFGEYAKIVAFLLAEGWTFALPREVVAWTEKKAAP
ncbi:MAG: DUF2334 domain-containing protein [Opitutaceae bacterium]|nr:DUF2334 domain-containing protein [Opitutaceae bacterium]